MSTVVGKKNQRSRSATVGLTRLMIESRISMTNLMHGDCLELMGNIPDKSIDAIICDLPYGTTACKWDVIIPFEPLWTHYERLIKPNGAIVLFASQPFTTDLINSNRKLFKYCFVWHKSAGAGFLNCKNAPIKMHEDICVFSYGTTANRSNRNMKYNPQGLKRIDALIKRKKKISETVGTRPSRKKDYIQTHTGYPTSIIKMKNDFTEFHPTQKPVALMEYLIRTYTNEGDTVLDNCMGSGSTGVACVNTNRNFIGIEKDDTYFDIAKKRIVSTQPLLI